jgi:hypothetical protein
MTTLTTGFTRSRAALTESGGAFWQGMLDSHLTALRQIIADPRAEHRRQSQLSAHRHPSRTAEPVPSR